MWENQSHRLDAPAEVKRHKQPSGHFWIWRGIFTGEDAPWEQFGVPDWQVFDVVTMAKTIYIYIHVYIYMEAEPLEISGLFWVKKS